MSSNIDTAIFGGGCFWCTEAVFQRIKGVLTVMPGYAGSNKPNPSYEEVSTGETGAQEAIKITYDPSIASYQTLLEVFFKTHDPSSYDRQGADTGSQYRSTIFYNTEEQMKVAEALIKKLDEAKIFPSKIVTEVKKFENFYDAEPYHKNYYERNKDYGYCQVVINPKLEKLYKEFGDIVKDIPSV